MAIKEDIGKLTKYWSGRFFVSEAEAREAFRDAEEHYNRQYGGVFAKKLTKSQIKRKADAVPVYRTRRGFCIGEKPKTARAGSKAFSWGGVRIAKTTLEDISDLASVFEDKLSKVQIAKMSSLLATEHHSMTPEGREKAKRIAESISGDSDAFFETIVVEPDGSIVDGHHRFEALKLLGAKEVPVRVLMRGSDG
jgi:hypothetical protein